ncbi:MAG: STAS domain-containing protein [Planctomycetota bacterium]
MSLDTGTPLIPDARSEGNALVCQLAGDLTIVNAPELRTALTQLIGAQKPKRLILNFADIKYIDSGALGVLIETRKQMTRLDGTVTLTDLGSEVQGLIRIMKLDAVFKIAETEAAALG